MYSKDSDVTAKQPAAKTHSRWVCVLLLCAFTFFFPWVASARDSTLIEPEQPIAPVLIVANYSWGICSQRLSSDLLLRMVSRPGPEPVALTQNPEFILCRLLPKAIAANLVTRGVDVALRELLLPGRVDAAEYDPQEKAFQERELSAPENAGRYALVYTGVAFERNLRILGTLAVYGPSDANSGKRPLLGQFLLNENALLVDMKGEPVLGVVPGNTYHLQSPLGAGAVIANSLESRCTKKAVLISVNCPDRLHLQAPN